MRRTSQRWRPRHTRPQDVQTWQRIMSATLLVALWCVALVGLTPVFAWGGWVVGAFLIFGGVLVTALLVRNFVSSATPLRSTLAGVAVWFSVWIVSFTVRGRFEAWITDPALELAGIWRRIEMGVAPLTVEGSLEDALLLIVLLVSAVTAYMFMQGWRLISGTVVVLLVLMPVAVTGMRLSFVTLLVSGVLLALLVWVGSPRPKPAGLMSSGLLLVVAAGVIQIVPDVRDKAWNVAVMFGPVSVTVPDVTVALAEDLRERSDTVAFDVVGLLPGSQRFTLATLVDFEEGTWLPQVELNEAGYSVNVTRWLGGLAPQADTTEGAQIEPNATIVIKGLRSTWLPMPTSTLRVWGMSGIDEREWVWIEGSPTARSESSITRDGDRYRMSAMPLLSYEVLSRMDDHFLSQNLPSLRSQLRMEDEKVPPEIAPFLALPEGMPKELRETANAVAGNAENRLEVAVMLQQYFTSGEFAYDESASYDPGANPDDSYAVMTAFLNQRSGFCVHYASTFAVMARELGVPTRLSIGYAASVGAADRGVEVRGTDLHVWPEIFVDDLGWVAFEPTPGGAGFRADNDIDILEEQKLIPEQTLRATPEPEIPALSDPNAGELEGVEASEGGSASEGTAIGMALFGLGLLVLLATPAIVRTARRMARASRVARGVQPAQQAWSEVTDLVTDLGLLTPTTPLRARTPGALIEYLSGQGELGDEGAAAMRQLAEWMEAERFGYGSSSTEYRAVEDGEHAEEVAACLTVARSELQDRAAGRTRIAAAVMPRSVLSRKSI